MNTSHNLPLPCSTDKGTAETSPHYNKLGARQPILIMLHDFSKEEFTGYLKGNVIKYTERAGLKAETDDAAKAKQYQKWLDEYTAFNCISIGTVVHSKDK